MKKFLIINPFGIGDCLFTTPVIKAIKEKYPDCFIAYWCNQRVGDLLKNNQKINLVISLSRGDLKKIFAVSFFEGMKAFFDLINKIRRERFDVCLDFSLDYRYGIITKLLGIKTRIGFNYKNRGFFLTHKSKINGYDSKHMVDYYLELLNYLDIKPFNPSLELSVSEKSLIRMQRVFQQAGLSENDFIVGIAPGAGASWGKSALLKHWPAIKYAQLAEKLVSELGAKVVILGDLSDVGTAEMISGMMKNKPLDLTGKTSLGDFAAAVKNLDILVTNDGGPLHVAVALGVKTVSLFGPVDELIYGPYPVSPKNIVIKKDLVCRPCYKNFRMPVCQHDRECIKTIEVEEVLSAIRRMK